jgi:hypothetical protein
MNGAQPNDLGFISQGGGEQGSQPARNWKLTGPSRRHGHPATLRLPIAYCLKARKVNVFGTMVGRGRGFSGVAAGAGPSSAVTVYTL